MQKNSANETAKNMIRIAKIKFGDRISKITLFNVTDEPYKNFSIKFVLYSYFVVQCNYDRGHFACSILFGEDTVPLDSDLEWDDNCEYELFGRDIDEQIRLRIPDKFLEKYGWI